METLPVDMIISITPTDPLAFGGMMPTSVVWSIFWANVLLKGAFTLIGMPLIYAVKGK